MELDGPYTILGPDGTRVVIGNGAAAVADPDWVGYVDPDNGIPGIEGAEVREVADNLVEQDGGVHGPFYEGRRAIVLNVVLNPNQRALAPALDRKLRRATRALREDALMRWTPSDVGIELELKLRRQAKPTPSGRWPKQLQIPMVSADSAKRSSVEAAMVIVPGVDAGLIGYSSPLTSPYGTELGETGQSFVVNQGDLDAIPRLRIDGPITNPEVLNYTTGKRLKLAYTLGAGEWLDVDFARKVVLLGGTASRFGAVVFPDTKWWRLPPGSSDIRLLAAAYSAGAQVTVYWRHAFD